MDTDLLTAQVTLDVREFDAETRITDAIYDDAGNWVGKMTDAEYELERSFRRGKRQFIVTAMCNGKTMTVLGPIGDKDKRDRLLEGAFARIGRSLVLGKPHITQ